MMRIANGRRPGLSLTEVLVTLFVMAIGIISLMTLFPVGAMQMGQALRDDRCGQTASQADGITRLWWQTEVVERPGTEDEFFHVMDNPNYPSAALPTMLARAQDGNASYPVVLDPIGWQARPGALRPATGQRDWMTKVAGSMPRRSARPLYTAGPLEARFTIRACSMMDDITFREDSTPDTTSGNTAGVVREGAYNWCAVIQRPNNSNRYVADFKVLVFHTKGLYGGHIPGSDPTGAETIYTPTSAVAGTTLVILPVAIANVGLRSGGWILDGTQTRVGVNTISKVANFYRVQSLTENPRSANETFLELDTPLKSNVTQLYILRGLADVFDRPQLTNSGYHRQAP